MATHLNCEHCFPNWDKVGMIGDGYTNPQNWCFGSQAAIEKLFFHLGAKTCLQYRCGTVDNEKYLG